MRVFLSISAIAALCVMMYFTQSGSTEKSLRGGSGMAGHQGRRNLEDLNYYDESYYDESFTGDDDEAEEGDILGGYDKYFSKHQNESDRRLEESAGDDGEASYYDEDADYYDDDGEAYDDDEDYYDDDEDYYDDDDIADADNDDDYYEEDDYYEDAE